MPTIPPFVRDDLTRLDIALDDAAMDRLALYLELLLRANEQFNLTSIREPDAAWRRHVIDSLTVLPGLTDLPAGASVIDVGSGGGLPGVPVAIARPDLRVALLEVTGKKAAFLRDVVRELGLTNVEVIQARAEDAGQDKQHREQYDAALCRAVGHMSELLEYTLPLVKVPGRLLAMKGPSVEPELEAAGDALTILGAGEMQVVEAYPEGFDQNTVIVVIEKVDPTPLDYPRKPGIPRQSPIGSPPPRR